MNDSLLDGERVAVARPVGLGSIVLYSFLFSLLFSGMGFAGGYYALQQEQSDGDVVADSTQQPTPIAPGATTTEDEQTIAAVEKVRPAVVSIIVEKDLSEYYQGGGYQDPFMFFGDPFGGFGDVYNESDIPEGPQPIGGGTGFIMSPDGLIMTNRHVVDDEEATYKVFLEDGRDFEATVVDRDTVNDLAIIRINATDLPTVTLGNSDTIAIGETVIAIGNSESLYANSVTKGIISGIDRSIYASDGYGYDGERLEGVVQTDAAINPGNSGGPLVNLDGHVIGINTAIDRSGQLIGFAIPINDAKIVIDTVLAHGRIIRPQLGVRYMLVTDVVKEANDLTVDHGAIVVRGESEAELAVMPGSPADKAGIVENDIILQVNGVDITEQQSLVRLIQKYKPGDDITLTVLHKDEEKEVTVTLSETSSANTSEDSDE